MYNLAKKPDAMDQIIVAIDFSKASVHALKYAIFLANHFKSDVMMVWVDNQSVPESVFADVTVDLRDEAKRNLEDLIEQHKDMLTAGELTFKLRKGKVYTEVSQLARQSEARMVVAGTHGVTGFEEFWIGSNAYRIVMNAPCPVITIRPQYDFSNGIRHIILPIDETRSTCQKVPFAADLAAVFNAEIHILAFYSTNLKALNQKVDHCVSEVRQQLISQGLHCTLESIMAENISRSTLEYADRMGAELITIMTEQETTSSNILLGEYAQQMVNNSPMPVLSIHPGEIIRRR